MANKSPLRNFIFIQGGLGSGKSSVIVSYIANIANTLWKDNVEIVGSAPHDTQLATFKPLELDDQHKMTLPHLIHTIFPEYDELKVIEDDTTGHTDKLNKETLDSVLEKSISVDALFTKGKDKKIIFFDEATFISERHLQMLTE